jgi:hypothetical protein
MSDSTKGETRRRGKEDGTRGQVIKQIERKKEERKT